MNVSEYNNNPGNLRPPKGVTYEGQIGVDDRGFAIFENKDYGQRALINDVNHKLENGIDTPSKFVDRFSPAGTENSEDSRNNYKIHLAEQLGLKSTNDPFPKDSADKIANAVSAFESGTLLQPISKENNEVNKKQQFGDISPETEKIITSSIGHTLGTTAGVTKLGAVKGFKKVYDWAHSPNISEPIEHVASIVNAEPKKHGGEKWGKALTGVDIPNAQMQKSDLDLAKGMQATVGRQGEPGFTGGRITQGGIIISPQDAAKIDEFINKKPSITERLSTLAKFGSPEQKAMAQSLWAKVKNIGSVSGLGAMGYGAGMSVPQAVAEYQKGNTADAIGTLGVGASMGAGMAMAPKVAPVVGAGLSALDVANRVQNKDYAGAGLSTIGTLGPMGALALLDPPIGIPLAIGSSFIPAAINAYRDYVNESPKNIEAGKKIPAKP